MFWKMLSSQLLQLGFNTNPYDRCVMNKMVDGKQCTILWHVNDLKISHVSPEVVNDIIQKLEGVFGKEAPSTKTRGSEIGKVKFTMVDYIKEMLEELPEDMNGICK